MNSPSGGGRPEPTVSVGACDFELLLVLLSSVWRHQFDPDDWKWNPPEAVSAYVVPKGVRTERTVD